MSPDQARDHFAGARVARLATAGDDGHPHIVPIVFALQGNRIYSAVDQKPKSTQSLKRLANIAANPRVAVLADHYEEDWAKLWWVRADGRARILDPDRDEEAQAAVGLLRDRYPQQRVTGAVLAVDVERWSGWSAA